MTEHQLNQQLLKHFMKNVASVNFDQRFNITHAVYTAYKNLYILSDDYGVIIGRVKDIAEQIGCSYTTIKRTMKELDMKNIIHVSKITSKKDRRNKSVCIRFMDATKEPDKFLKTKRMLRNRVEQNKHKKNLVQRLADATYALSEDEGNTCSVGIDDIAELAGACRSSVSTNKVFFSKKTVYNYIRGDFEWGPVAERKSTYQLHSYKPLILSNKAIRMSDEEPSIIDQTDLAESIFEARKQGNNCVKIMAKNYPLGDRFEVLDRYRGSDIYMIACNTKEKLKTARPSDVHVESKNYLFFDFDLANEGYTRNQIINMADHLKNRLEGTKYSNYEHIAFSGGGLHLVYSTKNTLIDQQNYKAGYKAACQEIAKLTDMVPDEACCNPARIMRMVGSINNKRKNKEQTLVLDVKAETSDIINYIQNKGKQLAMMPEWMKDSPQRKYSFYCKRTKLHEFVLNKHMNRFDNSVYDKARRQIDVAQLVSRSMGWETRTRGNKTNFIGRDGMSAAYVIDNKLFCRDSKDISNDSGMMDAFDAVTYFQFSGDKTQSYEYVKAL